MPHVNILMYPGRSFDQKKKLAQEIAQSVCRIANCEMKSISIAIEEISPERWPEEVYRPQIIEKEDKLFIRPGYNPFETKIGP